MAPHSSTLAWKIPWMEEPGRLQSMGSLRVRHDWANSLSLFTFMHWRRKWQPTPVFSPGESQGWGILVGCRLWGRTESDTTEVTQQVTTGYIQSNRWKAKQTNKKKVSWWKQSKGAASLKYWISLSMNTFACAHWPSVHVLLWSFYSNLLPIS